MIYTSYFASKAPAERKVSIAKWPPRNWKSPRAKLFAPSDPKAPNWAERYRAEIEARFPEGKWLKSYLKEIESQTPDPILCCYEADPAECHRSILAKYIRETTGIEVLEWVPFQEV